MRGSFRNTHSDALSTHFLCQKLFLARGPSLNLFGNRTDFLHDRRHDSCSTTCGTDTSTSRLRNLLLWYKTLNSSTVSSLICGLDTSTVCLGSPSLHWFVWCRPHHLDALLHLLRHWHVDDLFADAVMLSSTLGVRTGAESVPALQDFVPISNSHDSRLCCCCSLRCADCPHLFIIKRDPHMLACHSLLILLRRIEQFWDHRWYFSWTLYRNMCVSFLDVVHDHRVLLWLSYVVLRLLAPQLSRHGHVQYRRSLSLRHRGNRESSSPTCCCVFWTQQCGDHSSSIRQHAVSWSTVTHVSHDLTI